MEIEELRLEMGERLKMYRTQIGYSQKKFAASVGLSLNYYGKIERGIEGLSLEKLVRVHEVHRLDPLFLLTGNKRPAYNFESLMLQCPREKRCDLEQLLAYIALLAK